MIYFNNASAWTRVYLGNTEYSKVYSSQALVFPTTPPTPTGSKLIAYDRNTGAETILECDGNPTLTSAETRDNHYVEWGNASAMTIGDCVTSIEGANFWRSVPSYLVALNLPSSLTYIGDSAFSSFISLPNVTIPSGVTSIGNSAFGNCSGLTSVTFANGSQLTTLDGSFGSCRALSSITLPNSLTTIGKNTFYACTSLTSITIPSGVTSIGATAFIHCSGLTSITCLATTPPTLGGSAFNDTNECNIYVPCESVDAYKAASGWHMTTYESRIQPIPGSCGFSGKVMLEFPSHYSPSSVTADCSSSSTITSQEISDLITGGSKTSLRAITIGSCATEVGYRAFIDYTSATSLTFSENGNLTTIGERAFDNCKSLTSVTLPNTVTSVSTGAFRDCSAMTHFSFSTAMTAVPDDMFYQDYSLSSVTIPSGITSIGDGAFQQCTGLTSIVIPSGVTSIGTSAFYYCRNLASITCLASTPPTLGTSTFNGSTCPIYVQSASVNTYKAASGWSSYASRIQAIPNS